MKAPDCRTVRKVVKAALARNKRRQLGRHDWHVIVLWINGDIEPLPSITELIADNKED